MKYLDNSIDELKISTTLINKLKNNNIYYIKDIWILKRKELKTLNFSEKEINEIIIKLQLNGFDLNKKVY